MLIVLSAEILGIELRHLLFENYECRPPDVHDCKPGTCLRTPGFGEDAAVGNGFCVLRNVGEVWSSMSRRVGCVCTNSRLI